MVFYRSRRKFKNNIELVINDMKIRETKSIQYLGVIISSKKAMLIFYHTFTYPYLTCCVEIWGCAEKTHLSPLYLLHKRIVRIITFSDNMAHTDPIFKDFHVLPIDKPIHNRIGVFMYKIFYKLHQQLLTVCTHKI